MLHSIVKVLKLPHAPIELPQLATKGSSGMDIQAAILEPIHLMPFERKLIPTGLVFQIPCGFEMQLRPRSGLSYKHGITLINCVGTIDSDYRQEVFVPLVNLSKEAYTINCGDRIAQAVVCPSVYTTLEEVYELFEKRSRFGGFGSTGV